MDIGRPGAYCSHIPTINYIIQNNDEGIKKYLSKEDKLIFESALVEIFKEKRTIDRKLYLSIAFVAFLSIFNFFISISGFLILGFIFYKKYAILNDKYVPISEYNENKSLFENKIFNLILEKFKRD